MISLARSLSIAGHPAVLMPLTAFGRALVSNANPSLAAWVGAVAGLVAALVLAFSLLRVHSGDWGHIDASQPKERAHLNLVLGFLLFAASLATHLYAAPSPVVLGFALSGAVVLLALLIRKRLKLSLHVAFAVLAALLWWPFICAVAIGLAFAAGVSWSRLELKRHRPSEVVVGAIAGGLAGAAFHYWVGG